MEWWIQLSEIIRNFGLLGAALVGVVWPECVLSPRTGKPMPLCGRRSWQGACTSVITLQQIAEDFPDLTGAVFALLNLYVRNVVPEGDQLRAAPDVQEIMQILTMFGMSNRMRKGRAIKRPPGFVLDIQGAFVRGTDLSFANLERANLAGADVTGANLRGANFKDANLEGTILKGADLRDARNLTREQLSHAIIDETTKLPDYFEA